MLHCARTTRSRYPNAALTKATMDMLTSTLGRARRILRTEGFLALLRSALRLLARGVLQYETYYLYQQPTEHARMMKEADVMPKIPDFTFEVVATNEEADELEASGLEIRSYARNTRQRLDREAVAFCLFVGHELSNISWLATTQAAMDSLNEPPVKVSFSSSEAYRGGIWTNPKYRRMRFSQYSLLKKLEYLDERGIRTSRVVISKRNVTSQEGQMAFAPVKYGEGRYLRVLGARFWRERPVETGC